MATEATTYPVFDGVNELIDLYHLAESELVDAGVIFPTRQARMHWAVDEYALEFPGANKANAFAALDRALWRMLHDGSR